jgi:hypothetical protein
MTDTISEDHCSRWGGIPQAKQTEFTRRAIGLMVAAFRMGVYNLPVLWNRVDWRYGNGVSFILGNRPALASWDFNQLTRLVIGAHDDCIRVEVEPHGFGYLKINMWPREGREGSMSKRHPTIEEAVATYREDYPAPQPIVVGIKPLEWKPDDVPGVEGTYFKADTSIGRYEVFEFTVNLTTGSRTIRGWKGHWVNADQPAESLDDAQAAAQADYEARIRAALSSPIEGGE